MSSEWQAIPLGEILTQIKRTELVADLDQIPFAGVRWYAEGVYRRDTLPAADVKTKALNRIELDDIVYNRMWATKASFGRVKEGAAGCLVTNDFPTFVVDPEKSLPAFVELQFRQTAFQAAASLAATGTTERRRLNERDFVKIAISLPPLEEQRRIVDLIAAIDDSIEAAEFHVGSLADLLSATQSDVPPGPSLPFGELLEGIDSGISSKPSGESTVGDPVGILKVSAVRPARFQPLEIKPVGVLQLPEKARVVEGDLLMTRSNTPSTVGHVCIAREVPINSFMPDLVWRLRVDATRVTQSYLEHYLSSMPMRTAITSSATGTSQSMRKVNKRGVSLLPISVPPLGDQERYSAACDSIRGALEAARATASSLRVLRSELLASLLSGAHRIPETYDELRGA